DCAPALAWGQASIDGGTPPASPALPMEAERRVPSESMRVPASPASIAERPAALPQTVLVVGPATLADLLTQPIDAPAEMSAAGPELEVERTDEGRSALDLARALAPDLVLVDADKPGALHLVEALLADPLTEPVPVMVVGRWAKPEQAGPFVALGV